MNPGLDPAVLFLGIQLLDAVTLLLLHKLAHLHRGEGETEERGRPLQIAKWQL